MSNGEEHPLQQHAQSHMKGGSDPLNWEELADFVKLSGDTMTGLLTLSGPPVNDLHAVTKKYMDDHLYSPLVLDPMEYADHETAQAAYVNGDEYSSDILTGGTATADTDFGGTQPAPNACDDNEATYWQSDEVAFPHWWKYDFGAGVTKIVRKLRVKPGYSVAYQRFKDFKLQGSNNDLDWDDLYTGQHAQTIDWEDYIIPNTTAYRYYRLWITSDWEGYVFANIYEIEMMELVLQCYSESTIKQRGFYSLKVSAKETDSLNDTLTRTLTMTKDLSGQTKIKFYIRASREGTNFKVGFHDSGGITTEHTPNITVANVWQEEEVDISGVADANKDVIDQIIITITNADADNIIYLDYINAPEPGVLGGEAGFGDMLKSVYDTDDDGRVNDAAKLAGYTLAQVRDHAPRTHTLNSHSCPDGNVDFGGHKGVDVANPTNPQDAATKAYVDSLV